MALSNFAPPIAADHKKNLVVTGRNRKKQLAMAFVDPRIEAIERERQARGVSHRQLCARACMDPATWYSLRTGEQRPRLASIARLAQAVRLIPARPPPLLALARAIEALIRSVFAADPILRELLVYERPNRSLVPAAVSRARVRTLATYVLVAELGLRAADIAAAIGVGRKNILEACKHTAELIENKPLARDAIDALLRQLGSTEDDHGAGC